MTEAGAGVGTSPRGDWVDHLRGMLEPLTATYRWKLDDLDLDLLRSAWPR